MALLILYVSVRGLAGAATKPFGYDEIMTQTVASQPCPRGIWEALERALDGQAPVFYVLEHAAMGLVRNVHVALRLLSILAMDCTLICMFLYMNKCSGTLVAFLCALLLLSTSIFIPHAVNARSYSMLVACIAFALVCYQRLPSPLWAALLGLSLALAQSLHYYAIFALVPFGSSEAVQLFKARRLRWQVWLALAFGTLPLFFFWPLLSALKTYYGAHTWSHFGLAEFPYVYGNFFLTTPAIGVAIATVSLAGAFGSHLWPRRLDSAGVQRSQTDLGEQVLVGVLVVLPFIAFAATKLAHGGMVDKYAIEAVLGIDMAIACVFSRANAKTVALLAIFVFANVSIHELSFWRSTHSFHLAPQATPVEDFVSNAGYAGLPIVVSDGLTYVPLTYYASPLWAKKFIYLADEQKAVQYLGTDSAEKEIQVLRRYKSLEVSDFSEFTSTHHVFLVYAEDPNPGFDWLLPYLSSEAASLRMVAMQQNRRLYLVTMKGTGPQQKAL